MQSKDIGNYIVYSDGKVWSKWKKDWIKSFLNAKGYLRTRINNKNIKIHQLVAESFLPNPLNLPQLNHRSGIKTDNKVQNLEWCTASENGKHACRLGLNPGANANGKMTGSKHPLAKLSEEQVRKIKYEHKDLTLAKISALYNCSKVTASHIRNGKQWTHI